jgi:hypothetical protein
VVEQKVFVSQGLIPATNRHSRASGNLDVVDFKEPGFPIKPSGMTGLIDSKIFGDPTLGGFFISNPPIPINKGGEQFPLFSKEGPGEIL